MKGDSLEEKEIPKKVLQCRKKVNGDPLVSSGFVDYVKKVKTEKGTLCSKFPLAGLGFNSFSSFCKKWTFQCEVCGLEKKSVIVRIGRFLLHKKRRLKTPDHVFNSPQAASGERREKVRIPLCRHRLRWNFGPIK